MALASEVSFGLSWHCPTNLTLDLLRTSVKRSPLVLNDRAHTISTCLLERYLISLPAAYPLRWAEVRVSWQELAWAVTLPAKPALSSQRAARQDKSAEFGRRTKAMWRLWEKQLLPSWEALAGSQWLRACPLLLHSNSAPERTALHRGQNQAWQRMGFHLVIIASFSRDEVHDLQ